ncbi:signal recognition particle SRP9/SRP14 subunit [Stereum hirsutum FP-91666 SS1]|uniref:signal recognition particle SRP9/SRP14 subunit n=1 Tax=Stereum hirsutum (strain FP-91666) TaxID=721885 RepID=UPI000440AA3F|nr:signal recognition particle SRP9/SRP14 subunit [Stereum hirsutum FP-91666 SS1]EIM92874.1 signal recognition particle SRP9/SRP14 subunit [Stereum hirsutum FP-91666 SS1]
MQLVDNDTFLSHLGSLFESSKEKGSIWLTHKRLTHDGEDATMHSVDEDKEYPCLIRLTNGKDVNYSTHISSTSLPKFHSLYGSLLKSHLNPLLRKRDKKREKQRAEEITARKKKLNEPVVVEGPKRGAGRKKRQRKMKAAVRQEEAKRRIEEREAEKKK